MFQSKPQIALDQIRCAPAEDVPRGVVLADAGYGNSGIFRAGLSEAGLPYVVGIQSNVTFWPPGQEPLPAKASTGRGRPAVRLHRSPQHAPLSVRELAISRSADFSTVTWREGSNSDLTSRFAAFRVRPAARDYERIEPHTVEWLLIEWPDGEDEPTKYWLSTLPEATDLTTLVDRAKLRFRIERDDEELKSELGLAQFEERGWRGFHHHATLTIAVYGFLIRERPLFPLNRPHPQRTCRFQSSKTQRSPRYGRSVTSQIQSQPSVDISLSPLPNVSTDVPAAKSDIIAEFSDAAELEDGWSTSRFAERHFQPPTKQAALFDRLENRLRPFGIKDFVVSQPLGQP
jgi:SRSO17 transposase